MGTELTAKDKKLLFFLGFIVIIALFGLGAIRPMFTSMSKKDKEISKVKEDYDTMKMKLMRLDVITTYVDTMDKNVEILTKDYYPMMDSASIDKTITNKALGKNLTITNLDITTPTEYAKLEPYMYSGVKKEADKRAAAAAEASEEADSSGSSEEASSEEVAVEEEKSVEELLASGEVANLQDAIDEAGDTSHAGVYAVDVAISLSGNKVREQQFLDDLINNEPAIRVVSYGWGEQEYKYVRNSRGELVYRRMKDRTLSAKIQVYMYDESAYTLDRGDEEGAEEASESAE
ncbi:MAG: hypothetical protein K6F77_08965 [Lachnospiraceae bacterium]|nr:hypothetical protein [Lachnospiraceae bacterium]